jgi:methylenetetrahydrofolate reductase (NADPH)
VTVAVPVADLLADFSVEMTGKDAPALREAQPFLPRGTRVTVTFLGNESSELRVRAAEAAQQIGFVPVPHVAPGVLPRRMTWSRS